MEWSGSRESLSNRFRWLYRGLRIGPENLGAQIRYETQGTVWGLEPRELSVVSGVLDPSSEGPVLGLRPRSRVELWVSPTTPAQVSRRWMEYEDRRAMHSNKALWQMTLLGLGLQALPAGSHNTQPPTRTA